MNTVIAHVKNAIIELSAVSAYHKKQGRRNSSVSLCLAYAHSLLEFLVTGKNRDHKGRLRSRRFYVSGDYEWMLIEDTKNSKVLSFVARCEKHLTPELRREFRNSADRRYVVRRTNHVS